MKMSALTTRLNRFIAELRRRKVTRVAAGYVVAAWIILQVAIALEGSLKLPEWFDTLVLALLAIGLPIALVAAWMFDFTAQGIRRAAATTGEGDPPQTEAVDWILIAMIVLVLGIALVLLLSGDRTERPPTAVAAAPFVSDPVVTALPLGDKSIAVLPFVDVSSADSNEAFADGLTHEIIDTLAKIREIGVISSTSSFAFKGKKIPVPEIARQLGVRHILEGSVRRIGDVVRISARLVDVKTDTHRWSGSYARKMNNIVALQDSVATDVASALDVELELSGAGPTAPTKDKEAYRLFLEARGRVRVGSERDLTETIALYQRAIELDPNFAEAHAGLAACYVSQGTLGVRSIEQYAPLARAEAETAVKLKPSLAQGYAMLAFLAMNELDWETAMNNAEKAAALDHADSTVRFTLGALQYQVGDLAKAYATLQQALSIDPLNSQLRLTMMGLAFSEGRDSVALDLAEDVMNSPNADRYFAHYIRAYAARAAGKPDEAEAHFRDFMAELGAFPELIEPVVSALHIPKARPASAKAIADLYADNPDIEPELAYLMIGATDEFADALRARRLRGETSRASFYLFFAWRALFDEKKATPAFRNLMRALGLTAYWRSHGWPQKCRADGDDDFACD